MEKKALKTVALIVAHPDDETLWAGGTLLSHPSWKVFVCSLCRGNDPDRAPKFFEALKLLGAEGKMEALDDSPALKELSEKEVEQAILDLLPGKTYDLIITHHPRGEYTSHLRHEQTGKAVIKLWAAGKIATRELWCFAYEDGGKQYYPRPVQSANLVHHLDRQIWLEKYRLVTEIYGFDNHSWEAQTTPQTESFWQFTNLQDALQRLINLT